MTISGCFRKIIGLITRLQDNQQAQGRLIGRLVTIQEGQSPAIKSHRKRIEDLERSHNREHATRADQKCVGAPYYCGKCGEYHDEDNAF